MITLVIRVPVALVVVVAVAVVEFIIGNTSIGKSFMINSMYSTGDGDIGPGLIDSNTIKTTVGEENGSVENNGHVSRDDAHS